MHWSSSRDVKVDSGIVGKCPCCWGFTACHGHPTSRQAAVHIQQANLSFSITSIFPALWHFVKIIIILQTVDRQKQHVYLNNMMAQTWTNPSASTVFPFCRPPKIPAIAQAPWNAKLTVKASLIPLSRGVSFPWLDGRESCRTQEKAQTCISCLHTSVCWYTHTCVDIHADM